MTVQEIRNNIDNGVINRKKALVINAGLNRNNVLYTEDLLRNSVHLFDNVPFFIDHKQERSVLDVMGVLKNPIYSEYYKGIVCDIEVLNSKQEEFKVIEEINNSGLNVGLSAVFIASFEKDYESDKIIVNQIHKVMSVDFVLEPATYAHFMNSIQKQKEEVNEQKQEMQNMEKLNENLRIENKKLPNVKDYNTLLVENRINNFELDDVVAELIRKAFENKEEYLTQEEIDGKISELVAIRNKIYDKAEREVKQKYPAYITEESSDKVVKGILAALYNQKDVEKVPAYKSISQFWKDITGDLELRGEIVDRRKFSNFIQSVNELKNQDGIGIIVNGVTLGDFAVAFGNLMYRALLKEYSGMIDLMQWRKIVNVVNVRDFRPQVRIRVGGYPNLPIVNEAQNYLPLTTPTEQSVQYTVAKRGGTEDLTWETIVNDDIGVVKRIPQKLAYSAARTLFEFVMDFFYTNPQIYDGQSFFGSHPTALNTPGQVDSNIYTYTGSVDYRDIIAARVQMRKFRDPSVNRALGIYPKYIIGSVDFEEFMWLVRNNNVYPATTGATTGTSIFGANPPFTTDSNYVATFDLEPIVNPFVNDTTNLFMVADPNRFDGIEIGFLGSEEPEMFVQDLPNVGTYFFADKITYKIRHVYGGAVVDWRCAIRLNS